MKNILFVLAAFVAITAISFAKPSDLISDYDADAYFDSSYIKIIIIDSKNNRDSAMMMIHHEATLGIDAAYGEENLYGTTYKDPEIRIIQRQKGNATPIPNVAPSSIFWLPDSLKWLRSNIGSAYYTNENLDQKKDVRPFYDYVAGLNYPVFSVNASNFPITMMYETKGLLMLEYHAASTICSYNNNNPPQLVYCLEEMLIPFFRDTVKIYTKPEYLQKICIFYDILIAVDDSKSKEEEVIAYYPNPVNDLLNINLQNFEQISIFDMQGNQIYSSTAKELNYSIDVSSFDKGTYLLRIGNKPYKFVKR